MSIQELNPAATEHSDLNLKLADAIFVAFDTETTGLNPVAAHLVEICGVKFRGNGEELSTFQSLIKPPGTIPQEVIAIHGITDEMVKNEASFEEVVPEFMQWACAIDPAKPAGPDNATILVAHNAPFDISFVEIALCKLSAPIPGNLILDTLPLSRQLIEGALNHQLRTLIEHIGSDSATYHRALADSHHVRNLLLTMIKQLPPDATIESLVEIAGKLQFLDRSQADAESGWAEQPEYILIKQAIDDGFDLRISYSGVRKSLRVVTPRSVLFTGGRPYLSAFCHMALAERTFRIDRIIRMEQMDRQI